MTNDEALERIEELENEVARLHNALDKAVEALKNIQSDARRAANTASRAL